MTEELAALEAQREQVWQVLKAQRHEHYAIAEQTWSLRFCRSTSRRVVERVA